MNINIDFLDSIDDGRVDITTLVGSDTDDDEKEYDYSFLLCVNYLVKIDAQRDFKEIIHWKDAEQRLSDILEVSKCVRSFKMRGLFSNVQSEYTGLPRYTKAGNVESNLIVFDADVSFERNGAKNIFMFVRFIKSLFSIIAYANGYSYKYNSIYIIRNKKSRNSILPNPDSGNICRHFDVYEEVDDIADELDNVARLFGFFYEDCEQYKYRVMQNADDC